MNPCIMVLLKETDVNGIGERAAWSHHVHTENYVRCRCVK